MEDNPVDLDLAVRAFKKCNLFNPLQVARDSEEVMVLMKHWEDGESPPTVTLLDLHLPGIGWD